MTDQRQSVMDIMNSLEGVSLKEKAGKQFKFTMHLTEEMVGAPLETLDLSQRSYNCLMRAGYGTVGDICEAIAGGKSLKSIRNCGAKSVREIQEKLFLLQFNSLDASKREKYLQEVVRLNME